MIKDTSLQDTPRSAPSPHLRSRKGGALLVGLLLAGLAVAAAYPSIERWSSSSLTLDATRLRLATVQRGPFVRDIAVQGQIIAAIRPMLFSPQDGRVSTLVRAGDRVAE